MVCSLQCNLNDKRQSYTPFIFYTVSNKILKYLTETRLLNRAELLICNFSRKRYNVATEFLLFAQSKGLNCMTRLLSAFVLVLAILCTSPMEAWAVKSCPVFDPPNTWTNCIGETEVDLLSNYRGGFKNGKFHGEGILTRPDGTVQKGRWKDGEFVSSPSSKNSVSNQQKKSSQLVKSAEQKKLPLLGICRGMQIMAYKEGITLKPLVGHVGNRHKVKGEICRTVNSYHNLCISDCPDGYMVISRSEENSIEAIKHLKLPWEGWMWHPEREPQFANQDIERVKALFNS